MKTEKQRGEMLDSRGRKRSQSWSVNNQPSMTVQSQADQGDIQKILAKYKQVGIIENLRMTQAMFLDVSKFGDFQDVMQQTAAAEVEFMKLPSKVREIFHHNVAEWLDAAHDQGKRDALIAAGDIENAKKVMGDDPPAEGTPSKVEPGTTEIAPAD